MEISCSSMPFPSPHISLNTGLQVASEKITIIPAKQKNSNIELQAFDGNLFAWIIIYIYIRIVFQRTPVTAFRSEAVVLD